MRVCALRGHQKKKGNELNRTVSPDKEFMSGPDTCFYSCFPELKQFQDKIYILYASTHSDHAFHWRDTLEIINEIREARKQGKTKIVFFNGSETFMHPQLYKAQRIAELLKEVPQTDLFYCVGVPNGQAFYDNLCVERNWIPKFTVLGANHFEFVIHNYAKGIELDDLEYQAKPKEKLFVCFNKVHRSHRIRLFAEAIRNKWLDKSFYSFEGGYTDWYVLSEKRSWPASKEDHDAIMTIRDKLPLRLNITDERVNPVDLRIDDIKYHEESYFSIITETIFDRYDPVRSDFMYMDTLFLSEKIYKPFAFKHPFIVFGWPGVIRELKERGYKTFHPYINESYDDEPDSQKRFDMLIAEIKRLEQFTTEQWIEWQNNIKPLVEHNYKYLMNLTEHRDGPPVDHLFRI